MAVAYRIDKATYDKLPDMMKSEYDEDGDGYKLDLTGLDTKAADKLDAERGRRRAAEKGQRDAEEKLREAQEGDDRPALIAKHEKDLKKANDKAEASDKRLNDYVTRTLLDTEARKIADGLSKTNSDVLLPHVKARLSVDATDLDNPKLVILDKDGKASALKPDELHKEFVANKMFSGIIAGSQATGGAASRPGVTGPRGNPGVPANPSPHAGKRLSDMTPSELAAHRKAAAESAAAV